MSAVVRSTRRDFLKSTALGTAALAFPASSLFAAANADVARVAPKTLIIRGRMFTEGKIVDSGVRIENGSIVAVSSRDLGSAEQVITLTPRQILLPSAIDTHCSMRDWGEAHRDTVECVTRAALAGGVTVVCDMPNTVPRINTPELIRKRFEFVAQRSYTDFGISAHPPVEFDRVSEYPGAGAFSVSLFHWDLRPWNYPRDIDDSPERFRRFAEVGLTGLVFAEELGLRQTPLEYEAESYAIKALLRRLDPNFRVRIIATLPDSVERILAERERLPNALIEAAPHVLLMSKEAGYERIGVAAAHSPPLRSAADVARMREFAERGDIDIFVSSHAAHRTSDKYNTEAIPGEFTPKVSYSAIDFAYPLFLSRFGIERTCRCYCENPARLLGVRKGRIAPGYEADLTIMEQADLTVSEKAIHVTGRVASEVWRVEPTNFYSMGKVTPFVGERLSYRVAKTFLRGAEVYDAESRTFSRQPVRSVHTHESSQS
ncbi:MAG TPA: dihydroorotase family protein [Steroidobacter sp.]